MTLDRPIRLLAGSLVLVLALPAPASAQSIPEDALRGRNLDYQQGFRDGFREAMRTMQRPAGIGSGPMRGLLIEHARYGTERRACSFTGQLAAKAEGLREYSFRAGNQWCGDPHRGQDKMATVRFRCGKEARQIQVREGRTARLRCD